jgi:ATP-dependent Lhr-like helicase
MNPFTLLDEKIQKALKEKGLLQPTEPQERAISPILEGRNVLLIAPTGSGKTEAAMLPIFHLLLNSENKGISVLYITPLRALNRDMLDRMKFFSQQLDIEIEVRHGDTPQSQRRKQTLHPPRILITTPETLQAMLIGSRLREHLKNVRYVVVDEIHELVSSKRGAQLSIALERLASLAGEFQRIGLSATVGEPAKVASFLGGVGRDVQVVEVSLLKSMLFRVSCPAPDGGDKKLAEKLRCNTEMAAQLKVISNLLNSHRSTLIFVNTRQSAEALGARFKLLGMPVSVHHGSLSTQTRIDAENSFKKGELKALICTSSMELGIDVGDVDFVVQYMSPRQVTRLVQRVGRSGHRVDKTSEGIVIATSEDDIIESWAVARRARKGEIEKVEIQERSLDTLANQICGILLERRDLSTDEILGIVKRAYPYRDLTKSEFLECAEQLRSSGLVVLRDRISGRQSTRFYYTGNLSMIPDEKKFEIYDIISHRSIGMLDEAFVINFASQGATFITRGDMWRVVELEENRINVEPVEDISAEIPDWSGAEILVPYEIAQEVGETRALLEALVRERKNDADICAAVKDRYDTDFETAKKVAGYIRKQIAGGFPVATHRNVVVEVEGKTAIINACFGHKINETLGRVFSSLLSARYGISVGLSVDPYRLKLELPVKTSNKAIKELLFSLRPDYIYPIIEKVLRNTSLFRWKMVHVARKFGTMTEDVRYLDKKIVEIFEKTPIYEETLRELLLERLDVEKTKEVLKKILSGEIEVVFSTPSPVGLSGFAGRGELLVPERADRSILLALENRLMNDNVLLFCLSCRKYEVKKSVKNVDARPTCPHCESRLIAALKPWEAGEIKIYKKTGKTKDEEARAKRVRRNANLVLTYGSKAVIALAARGVGPEKAAQILRKMKEGEEFYRGIMEAERGYVLTRRFWD